MELHLERFAYAPDHTSGELFVIRGELKEHLCYTIERPWLGNAPNISCIPDGLYSMTPHVRPNGQRCYILQGDTVGLAPQHIGGRITRWGILIHPGNKPSDLAGCIAPGETYKPGRVAYSVKALTKMKRVLRPHFRQKFAMNLRIYPRLGASLPPPES